MIEDRALCSSVLLPILLLKFPKIKCQLYTYQGSPMRHCVVPRWHEQLLNPPHNFHSPREGSLTFHDRF